MNYFGIPVVEDPSIPEGVVFLVRKDPTQDLHVNPSPTPGNQEPLPRFSFDKLPPGPGYNYLGSGLWIRSDVPTEEWPAICKAHFEHTRNPQDG